MASCTVRCGNWSGDETPRNGGRRPRQSSVEALVALPVAAVEAGRP
jgi:hypothetical protein